MKRSLHVPAHMTRGMSAHDFVQQWNRDVPVGTAVVVTLDDGTKKHTKTRSEAWVVGQHTPVVSVEGISGGYLLDRVVRA